MTQFIRTLPNLLRLIERGEFLQQTDKAVLDLIETLSHSAKAWDQNATGKLTLTLSVTANQHGDIALTATRKITPPSPPDAKAGGHAFYDPDDPRSVTSHPQQQMDLIRDVTEPATRIADPHEEQA